MSSKACDVKRIVYLLALSLIIGLLLVHLRTRHMRAVYEIVQLGEQQQIMRQELLRQQLQLSAGIESPWRIKERLNELGVAVCPPAEAGKMD